MMSHHLAYSILLKNYFGSSSPLNFGSAAFCQTVSKYTISISAMERSAHKKTLIWQKKGTTSLAPQTVEAAPAHKVGLAKQLQLIATQRKQNLNANASCSDLVVGKEFQTSSPSLTTEVSEKCHDS
jgi:hypothetical protein